VLVTAGDGAAALPNTVADISVPLSLGVYADCGAGCTGAALLRSYAPWASNANGFQDRWGSRFITINSGSLGCGTGGYGCRSTFRQGRLVPSQDRGSLTLAGFDIAAGYSFSSGKREPALLELFHTGALQVTTPCTVPRSNPSAAQNASVERY
jgi:hypothetical protein